MLSHFGKDYEIHKLDFFNKPMIIFDPYDKAKK